MHLFIMNVQVSKDMLLDLTYYVSFRFHNSAMVDKGLGF